MEVLERINYSGLEKILHYGVKDPFRDYEFFATFRKLKKDSIIFAALTWGEISIEGTDLLLLLLLKFIFASLTK
jgi:hypothetical protein